MAYKTIQLAGGGSVEIAFPGKDGKTAPAQPLPSFRRVAVWPGDEGDVRFADRLQSSARFASVTAPAAVSTILADAKTPVDLKKLTEQEKEEAFAHVCQKARVEFIFASVSQGASANSNVLSFESSNVTVTADLLGYSCTQHRIVWRDQMALVLHMGSSISNTSAMSQAAADAWADRIFEAMGQPPSAPKA
jgi:hypothetical protein